MSHLRYFAYDGVGKTNLEHYGYNQAVKVGDRIECSGQGELLSMSFAMGCMESSDRCVGGWDAKTGEIQSDISGQIDQAFKNVDIALKDAGGRGWEQVCTFTTQPF